MSNMNDYQIQKITEFLDELYKTMQPVVSSLPAVATELTASFEKYKQTLAQDVEAHLKVELKDTGSRKILLPIDSKKTTVEIALEVKESARGYVVEIKPTDLNGYNNLVSQKSDYEIKNDLLKLTQSEFPVFQIAHVDIIKP